jgi:sugar O-acyltransferase (sialic acid O-acetyltransferase NeuD family)
MEIKPVMILGAKGLGKVALDIFKSNDVVVYGFLDDDATLHNTEIDFVPVYGETDDDGFLKLIGHKCDAFVAHDDNRYRKSLATMLQERRKVMPINAVHYQSYIASSAALGHGNLINVGANIGVGTTVGNHNILHAQVTLDYDVKVGDFVQIGAGSIVGAGTTIGDGAFIGTGTVIVSGITIGRNARIGAGSVVVESVGDGATVFGNPAKAVK